MGSPIGTTIANLVMEHVEETTIRANLYILPAGGSDMWTIVTPACRNNTYIINYVNPRIQFAIEVEENNRLSFLETLTTDSKEWARPS